MKLIITTQGNPECDPKNFINVYICDYFTIQKPFNDQQDMWITIYGGPDIPNGQKSLEIAYDPDIDDIVVMP